MTHHRRWFGALVALAMLLFAIPASADFTLSPRSSTPGCPFFTGCNLSEAEVVDLTAFGVFYDSLPVDEDLSIGSGELVWQTQIDNVDGIHVDAQGDPGDDWRVNADVTFTVDQVENYSISGSLTATGTTGALLDLHLQEVDAGGSTTIFRSLQESSGSTVSLASTGGGNVTDSVIGSNFGQLQPGVEYKYTVECSGAAASSIDCTTANPVPEPGMGAIMLSGIGGLIVLERRRRKGLE